MDNKLALKKRYNELLAREARAEKYLDSPERSLDEIAKWQPEFIKILDEINDIRGKIGSYTARELVQGFDIREDDTDGQ